MEIMRQAKNGVLHALTLGNRENDTDAIQYCPTNIHSKQTHEIGLAESTDMTVIC
jgi:hypothetical protein